MIKAKELSTPPVELAGKIVKWLQNNDTSGAFERISVAGPGFINFTLSKSFLLSQMVETVKQGDKFGSANIGKESKSRWNILTLTQIKLFIWVTCVMQS